MKIGIISDTHMMKNYMDKAILNLKNCDLIIHAGDNFCDSKYIYMMTNVPVMAVKGNCDYDEVEEELLFEVEGKTVFLCHGHKYGVKNGIDGLEIRAKHCKADIVIFGHTHTPLRVEKDDILYINPGSASYPRRVNYRSFVIIEIKDNKINLEEVLL